MKPGQTRKHEQGFMLLESILCVVLLTVGVISVFRPLMAAFAAFRYYETRRIADELMQNEIWRQQENILKLDKFTANEDNDFNLNGRHYRSRSQNKALDEDKSLYASEHRILWQTGGIEKQISQLVYLNAPVKDNAL